MFTFSVPRSGDVKRLSSLLLCAALVLTASIAATAAPAATTDTKRRPQSAEELVAARSEAILDQLEADNDFEKAADSALHLFDQVVGYIPSSQADAFLEASFLIRIVGQLSAVDEDKRIELLKYLRANKQLARAMVFTVRTGAEKPGDVYGVLNQLRAEHGDKLNDYANLVAAICVVHDRKVYRRINENQVNAPDATEIFEYFTNHEKRMLFGVRQVPPDLLIYVVDTTATIPEMEWALRRYQRDTNIGAQFFKIEYDYSHFRNHTVKKVTEAGYNLANILRYGGVCADQAYFAVSCGKAIGVPTAYTWARSGEVGHAWVSFFQVKGRDGQWNMNTGRYAEYRGVRGVLEDPQTGRNVPDSYLAVQAEMIGSTAVGRQQSIALVDAAARLINAGEDNRPFTPAPIDLTRPDQVLRTPREPTLQAKLDLIEAGLRLNPANVRGWFAVRKLAADGEMELKDIRTWAGHLNRMCGRKYPDFVASVVVPMIQSVEDINQQEQFWLRSVRYFGRRFDLQAELQMARAKMWEDDGQLMQAAKCYEGIWRNPQLANAGPFVLEALSRTEDLLEKAKRDEMIPKVYEASWKIIRRPKPSAFMHQSNWFRVGRRYKRVLEKFGETRKAEAVTAQLERVMGGPVE